MSYEQLGGNQSEVQPPLSLEELPTSLGFIENDELQDIRITAVSLMDSGDPEAIKATIIEYIGAGQRLVDSLEKKDLDEEFVGLEVAIALANRDVGRFHEYRESLRDARDMAKGFMDVHIKSQQSYAAYKMAIITLTNFIDEAAEKYDLPPLESRFHQPPLPE